MFNNNQLDLLMNIVNSMESGIRCMGHHHITNIKAYVNKYQNNQSLNKLLLEIEDVEDDYLYRMRNLRKRIMEEINL